jgi:hypothetical protein
VGDSDTGSRERVIIIVIFHLLEDEENSIEEDNAEEFNLHREPEFLVELLLAPYSEVFESVDLWYTQNLKNDPNS